MSVRESFERGNKALIHVTSVHLDFMMGLISGPAGEFPGDFDQVFFWERGPISDRSEGLILGP
jgi:hypothetical protein